MRAVATDARASLPETVVGMVQARLDALGEDPRRVLRAASIFGQTFTRAGVGSLLAERESPGAAHVPRRARDARGGLPARRRRRRVCLPTRAAARRRLTPCSPRATARSGTCWPPSSSRNPTRATPSCSSSTSSAAAIAGAPRPGAARPPRSPSRATTFPPAIARARHGAELGATGATLGRLHLIEAQAQFWRGEYTSAEASATSAARIFDGGTAPWYEALGELVTALGQQGKYPR